MPTSAPFGAEVLRYHHRRAQRLRQVGQHRGHGIEPTSRRDDGDEVEGRRGWRREQGIHEVLANLVR
jgi:hypothetical protein